MTLKNQLPLVAAAIGAAALAASCSSGPKGSASLGPDFLPGVSIVYSANVDGEIEPCGCRSNPMGGINRRWNLQTEKAAGEKLIIDSGDLFYQSSPVPQFLETQWNYQARVLLKAYNALGVEVMEPGELEFADGFAQFEKLVSEAKFKMVSANLYRTSDKKPLFEPYVILNKGGKRVGIFGLYDETLPLPPEVFAKDHVAAAQEAVSALRGKADVIIALTHEGFDKDMELPKKVSGIDAIFGAHTQSFLINPEKVGDTMVFQPSFRGQHIGVYAKGDNALYQMDERFDSKEGHTNLLDKLLADAKIEIARINKQTDMELMSNKDAKPIQQALKTETGYQTFSQCAQCHLDQYEFHRSKPHFMAYETLVKKHQNYNLDCLQCHTTGAGKPGGWKNVKNVVLNMSGKPIPPESFVKSLPSLDSKELARISKAFVNVQCENCHGPGAGHPMGTSKIVHAPTTSTCLQCHTKDRAPGWYGKDGKADMAIVEAKFKSMSCPPLRKN